MLVVGLTGACRGAEITNLTAQNVTDHGNELRVRIPTTKMKEPKMYIIDGEFAKIIREYVQLRPSNAKTNRFFLQYRNGKCINQVMGKHSIAKVPKEIAKFLQLPEPHTYTGHSYRRSSTTIAADAGASIEELKRLGKWKSSSVAEGYIQDSFEHKRKLFNYISSAVNLPPSTSSVGVIDVPESKFSVSGAGIDIPENVDLPSTSAIPFTDVTNSSIIETVRKATSKISVSGADIQTEGKENVIFHFAGECSNLTIINMK